MRRLREQEVGACLDDLALVRLEPVDHGQERVQGLARVRVLAARDLLLGALERRVRLRVRRHERSADAFHLELGVPALLQDLEQAMNELPSGARHVFVLHAVYGYSHDETGEMLGIATGTSKAQLHRAKRLLAQQLKPARDAV